MPPKLRVTRAATKSFLQPNAEEASASANPASSGTAAAAPDENAVFLPEPVGVTYSDSEDDGTRRNTKRVPAPPKPSGGARAAPIADSSDSDPSDVDNDVDYESDEDPIVREYDVYMTSELAHNLYLFQYPVRQSSKPYTKAQNCCPVDARWKPKAGVLEVDVPVNVALNFDQEKGRVWGDVLRKSQQAKESGLPGKAMGARGGKRRRVKGEDDDDDEEEDIMFMDFQEAVKKGRVLSKQTLGSKIQADEAKYMVGVFTGDQLHLTPVRSTLQLRPQFHHVDAQHAADRAQSKSLREADEPEKPTTARAVHMSVNQEVSQMSSTMKAIRQAEEEDFKKLHWIDQDEDAAWDQYELLCLRDPESAGRLKCSTGKAEYMDWLSGAMLRKREGGK